MEKKLKRVRTAKFIWTVGLKRKKWENGITLVSVV